MICDIRTDKLVVEGAKVEALPYCRCFYCYCECTAEYRFELRMEERLALRTELNVEPI